MDGPTGNLPIAIVFTAIDAAELDGADEVCRDRVLVVVVGEGGCRSRKRGLLAGELPIELREDFFDRLRVEFCREDEGLSVLLEGIGCADPHDRLPDDLAGSGRECAAEVGHGLDCLKKGGLGHEELEFFEEFFGFHFDEAAVGSSTMLASLSASVVVRISTKMGGNLVTSVTVVV